MAGPAFTPAKSVLLAVQLADKADIRCLRTLISQNRKTLHTELVLRILLSHLPESIDSSVYVLFLQDLDSASIEEDPDHPVDSSELSYLDDAEAKKKVRKLNLLALRWADAPDDAPEDPLVLFLIHRSLRIDLNTGLITQLPALLSPFLHRSQYLRNWMVSSILPLLRFNYEYYPEYATTLSISQFEALDGRAGVNLLLSRTGKGGRTADIGRDLKGLVGPWMYGRNLPRRRKSRTNSVYDVPSLTLALDEAPDYRYTAWEEVFTWLLSEATNSWRTAVEAVEQWDGPGDIDLGTYADGTEWLEEDDQIHLERRYARTILATAYSITETSEEALNGVQRILAKIITLLDKDRIPTLQAAAAILTPVSGLEEMSVSDQTNKCLRNGLLDEENTLTTPKADSIKLLHALLVSAYICGKLSFTMSIKSAGELFFLQNKEEQMNVYNSLMSQLASGPKEDDRYWIKTRNQILWLQNWGAEELAEEATDVSSTQNGRGILGSLPKEVIEMGILKALLTNTRYDLAKSIYERSEKPLGKELLVKTIVSAAMEAYDLATNPNRTRGGVKKAEDILHAFPDCLQDSLAADQANYLIKLAADMSEYRLVLKQGEAVSALRPGYLRVHGDPIQLLGTILEQNPGKYSEVDHFIDMGKTMVKAGLTLRNVNGETIATTEGIKAHELIAEKRIVALCVDAALAEDDFETAYSYVETRLKDVAGPAHTRTPTLERRGTGLFAEIPPKVIDDWSWRAALQAGKHKRSEQTLVRPSADSEVRANPEIRHLQQRIDCIAHALRLAPKATLQEILNVYRRCEEELESLLKQEQEDADALDAQADEGSEMPGGFANAKSPQNASRPAEESPMTIFELMNDTVGAAVKTLNRSRTAANTSSSQNLPQPTNEAPRVRKRDAAVGFLARGVGALLGATPTDINHGVSSNPGPSHRLGESVDR